MHGTTWIHAIGETVAIVVDGVGAKYLERLTDACGIELAVDIGAVDEAVAVVINKIIARFNCVAHDARRVAGAI